MGDIFRLEYVFIDFAVPKIVAYWNLYIINLKYQQHNNHLNLCGCVGNLKGYLVSEEHVKDSGISFISYMQMILKSGKN